ncbi:tetratricopeptide repeat protein [Saccharothrix sp. BKS2]|uniref:tetratricopeptide repeat protein n=1 Tax=Saccharothrix sp. BKS2 TaxID=3064400 RepID=UPI0039E760E7
MTPESGRFTARLRSAREHLRHDRPDEAADLLDTVWEAVPEGTSPESLAELRAVTEELGECKSTSPEAAAVFRRAGHYHAKGGRYQLARRMGTHELAVWRARAAGEPTPSRQTFTGYRDALDSLARIDCAVGRLHRVINGLDELLELQALHGLAVTVDAAWTLRELGAVMLQAGRPDTAIRRYLSRADDFYTRLGGSGAVARQHAVCLVLSALAHRDLDQPAKADRCVNRALAMLLSVDPAAAAEVRTLIDGPRTAGTVPVMTVLPLAGFGLPAWPRPDPRAPLTS